MKSLKLSISLILIYLVLGISPLYASSIHPAINRIQLSSGERTYGSVFFKNSENNDLEVNIVPYVYNPKSEKILSEKNNLFLKVDTDSIKVRANSEIEIKYEIYPLNNLNEGTYFNILTVTPQNTNENVDINMSISQLVILDIVESNSQVKGITTTQYLSKIEVIKRGIPFIKPTILRYTITNNSNYLLTPTGRIDVFNERNSYKPEYIYINEDKENIYPQESITKDVEISRWHIQDIFINRYVKAQIYNGVDNNPQNIEIKIENYLLQFGIFVLTILTLMTLPKILPSVKKLKKG